MPTLLETLRSDRGRKVGAAVLMSALSAMFFFCGYEFVRSPVESIFLAHWQATDKPYAIACVPVMMAAMIYLYGIMLSKIGAKKSMLVSMLSSGLLLFLAWLFVGTAGRWLAFFLLVFKESYVVIISEQYWSFINSVLKDDEGKIFNGPVAGIAAFGPLVGGWLISHYVQIIGTDRFLMYAAVIMIPALILAFAGYEKAGEPQPEKDEAGGKKGHLHLSLLFENKTVLFIALIIFSAQVVSTLLDFRWTQLVQNFISDQDARTAYFGRFWMLVNTFSFSMQFLLTPILLRNVERRAILVLIPAIHVLTCAGMFFFPSLRMASTAFFMFKGLDYSIFRASKETLYIPLSYDTRYRAKQVADAFMYRFAKGATATAISGLKNLITIAPGFYPALSAVFAAIWLGLSFPLTAARKKA